MSDTTSNNHLLRPSRLALIYLNERLKAMASWIPVPEDSDFPLQNLPYGVFSFDGSEPRIGIAIGDSVLDLKVLAQEHVFDDLGFDLTTLSATTLNAYAALGKSIHRVLRNRLQQLLEKDTKLGHVLRDNQDRQNRSLKQLSSVKMHLPMQIGDYTDFFVGLSHAETVRIYSSNHEESMTDILSSERA